jgi:hypothetical protein
LACLLLALMTPATVLADESTRTLWVRIDVGSSGLDPSELREAIARELEVAVTSEPGEATGDTLDVRIGEHAITIVYAERGAEELKRVVERPKNRNKEVEVIAWLAGNLARDEARDLAEELGPKPAPPAPKPAPAPAKRPPPPKRTQRAYFNLSLFHPLAIYPDSHERQIYAELGLVYGRIGELRGVAVDVGVTRIDFSAKGATVSGIWRSSNGPDDGAFVAGIFSMSGARLRGTEAAGIFNSRTGDVQGGQFSGIFNTAHNVDGFQASGIFNRAKRMRGGQAAIVNLSGDGIGAATGFVNIGDNLDGLQIGLFNVAQRVRGAQIGLVSIADRVDGLALSPVSILSENRTQAAFWYDTLLEVNAGVKYLTGPVYSLFTFGVRPAPEDEVSTGWGVGIGVPLIKIEPIFADVDLLYRYRVPATIRPDFEDAHSTVLRAVAGLQLAPAIAVIGMAGAEFRVDDQYRGLPYVGAGLQFF